MNGYLKFNTLSSANDFVDNINNCLGLPMGDTETWDEPQSFCEIDPITSGATEFWGYVVKIKTDQMGQCMTQQQIDDIIQLPNDVLICQSI